MIGDRPVCVLLLALPIWLLDPVPGGRRCQLQEGSIKSANFANFVRNCDTFKPQKTCLYLLYATFVNSDLK